MSAYPVCVSLADATGRAWTALDGTVGRRVSAAGPARGSADSACGLGETVRRHGSGWAARPPGPLGGIQVKVTAAWPHVCAGTGPVMPPSSAAGWDTGQMPGLARPSPGFLLL